MNNITPAFDYRLKKNSLVIYLNETLDFASSAYFERSISDLIKKHPECNVVLNMSDVPYMNSAGLGVLIVLTKKLEEKHLMLKISNINRSLQKVISLLDAEGLVNVYNDESDALV